MIVIATPAKAGGSNPVWCQSGLLRRFASRNDGDVMAIKLHSTFAVHPGKWLRTEVLEPAGLNVTDLANRLGVSRQSISNLLNGHQGLSAEMAIRFAKAFALKADTLIRMQSAYEFAEARARKAKN